MSSTLIIASLLPALGKYFLQIARLTYRDTNVYSTLTVRTYVKEEYCASTLRLNMTCCVEKSAYLQENLAKFEGLYVSILFRIHMQN